MGREAYGIAGCVTHRPPEMPLAVSGEISPGEVLAVGPMQLRAVALPGHGLCALGYVLETAVEPREVLALFSGDLLRDGPCLVNMYDLETTYGGTAVHELPSLLRIAAALDAPVFFPATGPVLPHGPGSAIELAGRIEEFLDSLRWSSGQFSPASAPATPPFSLGRYARIQRGVYQITNFGNCIVLIDDLGRGLMVDPGPCDFENSRRVEAFHADLDLLEKDGGLKSIERLLITHFHGDHYDMTQQVLRRYPRCRVAAWDLVAQVIESPDDFPYACKLPWYNLGLDRVQVDDVTHVGKPYFWNDIRIDTEHLPGHSEAHAAYVLIFNGSRLAITGDSIQSRGDADGLNYILCNESVPEENSGCIAAYKAISRHAIDLNVGGHGSHFRDCAAQYAESLRRMRHALPFLRNLFPHGDLRAAFHRPWFPDLRERRVTTDPA